MTIAANLSPAELRPLLAQKVSELGDDEVQTLARIMLKLEAQRLWDEIKREGAADRKAGKLDRLEETIAHVRAEMAAAR